MVFLEHEVSLKFFAMQFDKFENTINIILEHYVMFLITLANKSDDIFLFQFFLL